MLLFGGLNMKPIRVLHVINGLGSGGAESFLMNIYRNIDKSKIQFDFLIRSTEENIYLDEIDKLGGKVYITSSFPKHFFKNYKEVNRFFKDHKEYNIIHVHANALLYVRPLTIAKVYGIKCRIIHSHSTQTVNNYVYRFIHKWNKKFISSKATEFFACSVSAGNWMFKNEFKVINNAIDIDKFKFRPDSRERVRKEFNMENRFVVGNIGRFVCPKNHAFIIDIFYEIYKENKNAVLMLVGTGELFEDIKTRVNLLGLQDSVIFTGVRKDVPDILCAMDVFLFPSLYEGLGLVLIEAQASGLHCIASDDVIPKETKVTNLVEYIMLNKSSSEWAKSVLKYQNVYIRENTYMQIKNSGFDIKDLAQSLEEFYLNQ